MVIYWDQTQSLYKILRRPPWIGPLTTSVFAIKARTSNILATGLIYPWASISHMQYSAFVHSEQYTIDYLTHFGIQISVYFYSLLLVFTRPLMGKLEFSWVFNLQLYPTCKKSWCMQKYIFYSNWCDLFLVVYSFDGLVVFGLLVICTCAYMSRVPKLKQWLLSEKKGFFGVFYKGKY